jgi:hypothetical protein
MYQLFAIVKAVVEFYDLVGIIAGEVFVAVVYEAEKQRDFTISNWRLLSTIRNCHLNQLKLKVYHTFALINALPAMYRGNKIFC